MAFLERNANRGSISTAAYEIDNSVKLEPDNSESIQRAHGDIGTPTSAKIVTISFWIKRTELLASGDHKIFEGAAGGNKTWISWNNDRLKVKSDFANPQNLITTRVFRDCSAWYHICIAIDTSQGTAANRVKIYINGVQETAFDTETYPNQDNNSYFFESSMAHYIGGVSGGGAGYWAEFYFLDGQVKGTTDFGEFDSDTGIWIPKAYGGAFGDEGYHIDFEDSSALGADVSGNSNNFGTLTNVAAADQATDTPTNNFCTLNPLIKPKYGTNAGGMIEGATEFGDDTGGGVGGALGTMAVTAGKWYWEMKLTQQNDHYVGVSAVDDNDNFYASSDPQDINSTVNFAISAARYEYFNGGSKTYGSTDAFTDFHSTGDIISIALNMDDNQISIYGNGTLQAGVANSSLYDAANKMCVPFHGTINDTVQYNFGGYSAWTPSSIANDANGYGSFEYAPPSGYYALCTKNLSEFGG